MVLRIEFLNQNAIQKASITMAVAGKALVVDPATKVPIKFTGAQNISKTYDLTRDLPKGIDVHHAISLRFYVSLGTPLDASQFNAWGAPSLTNPSDPNWNVRWDIFEVTVTPTPGDYGDLSTINGYAIPMAIDTFKEPTPRKVPGTGMSTARSYKAGDPYGALKALMNANSANNNYGGYPPLVPANGIVTNGGQFVRLIGPNNGGFSPTLAMGGPFPSFNGYLEKVYSGGITTKFTDDGEVPGHTWDLKAGAIAVMNTHQMTLGGKIDGTDFSMRIDADSNVGTASAMYTFSSMVYMAPGPGTGNPGLHFTIGGQKSSEQDAVNKFGHDTVAQIYHDLFTAYTFGVIGNQQKVAGWSDPTYGNLSLNDMGSAGWRQLALDAIPSSQIPLFSKNILGPGCHNEWASTIYASSTTVYGFAYSDAFQPSIPQYSCQMKDGTPVNSWLVTILEDP